MVDLVWSKRHVNVWRHLLFSPLKWSGFIRMRGRCMLDPWCPLPDLQYSSFIVLLCCAKWRTQIGYWSKLFYIVYIYVQYMSLLVAPGVFQLTCRNNASKCCTLISSYFATAQNMAVIRGPLAQSFQVNRNLCTTCSCCCQNSRILLCISFKQNTCCSSRFDKVPQVYTVHSIKHRVEPWTCASRGWECCCCECSVRLSYDLSPAVPSLSHFKLYLDIILQVAASL